MAADTFTDPDEEKLKMILGNCMYELKKHGYHPPLEGQLTINIHQGKPTAKVMVNSRLMISRQPLKA